MINLVIKQKQKQISETKLFANFERGGGKCEVSVAYLLVEVVRL